MITLKDLAKELNVSISTVSKALNNSYEISEDTIAKVKELAKKYNYKPNKAALSLKKSKTRTIGVVLPNILNPFFARSLHSIEQEASKHDYSIITCISNESIDKEKKSIELLTDGSVDGFLISVAEETQTSGEVEHLEELMLYNRLPVVMFDRFIKSIDCDKVIIDDLKAVYEATNYLISEGRKKIILLDSLTGLNVGKLRVDGYKKAIEESNSYKNAPIIFEVTNDANVDDSIEKIMSAHKDIDAIIAIDNVLGVVALNIARKFNISMPSELSIIGFSGKNVVVFTNPKLTTISQHTEEIGKRALQLLIDRIEKKDVSENKTLVIDTNLIHRETTKYK